jgi:hypothetical protein
MDEVDQARALRAERAAIDRVVGIAFYMNDAGFGVLGVVAQSLHQDAAAYRAVRARVAGFSGARQLVLADFGKRRRRREAHQGKARSGERARGNLEELSPGHLQHG